MFLKSALAVEPRGSLTRWAKAAGCQPSYLSQTLSREVQLTPDHALGLGKHLGFSLLELDYWMALVDLARAGSPALQERLREKVETLRLKSENMGKRLQRDPKPLEQFESTYYQSWIYVAVHVCTDIPTCQTPERIAERLGLKGELVRVVLERLKEVGLVHQKGSKWVHSQRETHVDRNSPHVLHHHQNWRQRAMLDAQQTPSGGLHFTGTYAVSQEMVGKLKEKLLATIKDFHQQIGGDTSETLVNFNADFYELS